MRAYGINVSDVEAVVQVAIGGRAFTRMIEGEKSYDIVLRLPADQRNDPEVIGRIPVDAPGQDGKPGVRVPCSSSSSGSTRTSPGDVHLPREQPPLHPHQVWRQRPGPGFHDSEAQRKVEDPKTGAASARI